MQETTLVAERGRPTGSRNSNRLRAQGKVPGVVYGHGSEPLPIAVDARGLRAALSTDAGANALINLTVGDQVHLTLMKELQRDPVRRVVTHVDFILISRDEAITVDVRIQLEGDAEQVHREDGTVEQQMFTLSVSCKPAEIPPQLTYDISGMTIGDTVKVGDLQLPSGVTTDVDPDETVASAQITRATLEAEAIEAEIEAEAAEAEGVEAAEGEAPAAADDGAGDDSDGDES